MEHLGKEPSNFTRERNETFKFEQKSRKNKKLIKNWKKKKKRHKIAEKNKQTNKLLKRKKNLDEEKIEEKELWGKLNKLNKEFQTINNIKKKQIKCLRQY